MRSGNDFVRTSDEFIGGQMMVSGRLVALEPIRLILTGDIWSVIMA